MKKTLFLILLFTNAICAKATVSVDITGQLANICPYNIYTYDFTETNDLFTEYASASYEWIVNGGTIIGSSTGRTVNISWNNFTGGAIFLTFHYYYYPIDPRIALDNKAVFINASINSSAPLISGAFSGNPNYIPINQSVTFSVPVIPNVNSYTWTFPPCFSLSSITTTTNSVSVSTTGTCSGNVGVSGHNPCGFNSNATLLFITRIPIIPSISGVNSFCGTSTTTHSITNIAGISFYTWTVPAGWFVNGVLTTTGIVTLASPSGYTINLTPPSGYIGTTTISVYGTVSSIGNTNTQSKTISNAPLATPAYLPFNPTSSCLSTPITWAVNPVLFATSYTWSFVPTSGGGTSTGLTLAPSSNSCDIVGHHLGYYTISVKANNLCGSGPVKTGLFQIVNTGPCAPKEASFEVIPVQNEIIVFPNPVSQNLSITIISNESSKYDVSLYDILGKKVYFTTKVVETGSNETDLDVSEIPKGIYILFVENGSGIKKQKIVVSH